MDGKYNGRYAVRGHALRRESDGLHLLIVNREYVTDPAKGTRFILDKTHPSGTYVSSLWADEFEYQGIRYRINWIGDTRAEIEALYVVRRRHKDRSPAPSRRRSTGRPGSVAGEGDGLS